MAPQFVVRARIRLLRAVQREAVLEALRWGQSDGAGASAADAAKSGAWRVLVLDASARDMLAPLLKVKAELKDIGVSAGRPMARR